MTDFDLATMPPGEAVIRTAKASDAAPCAKILQDWLDITPWMLDLHSLDETVGFLGRKIFPSHEVVVADAGDEGIVGFIAWNDEGSIPVLYVADGWRSKRIGASLLAVAKRAHPQGLSLWTFQDNEGAKRFYEAQGFREVRRTDGDNEEGLPDILFEWSGTGDAG